MLISTIAISSIMVIGTGGLLIYYKNKNKKVEKEIVVPHTRPAQERIQFAKVSANVTKAPITTSNVKQNLTHPRSSNTVRSHNTYDDDLSLLNTVIMVDAIDSIADSHTHRSHSYHDSHDYGSSSHGSSYDSSSSYDSGGNYDSGSCDCSCGCD